MKQFWFQIITLIIVIGVALYLTQNSSLIPSFTNPLSTGTQTANTPQKIQILSNTTNAPKVKATLNIELADTQEKRGLGLGGRDSLDPNSGMLFLFDTSGNYKFWMKGMKFPLDFIWISRGQVVDLLLDVPVPKIGEADSALPVYGSVVQIDRVLEVNAGFIASHNISVGDKIKSLGP